MQPVSHYHKSQSIWFLNFLCKGLTFYFPDNYTIVSFIVQFVTNQMSQKDISRKSCCASVHAWMSLSLALVVVYPFQTTSFGQTSPETHLALCMGGQTNHLTLDLLTLKQIHGNRTPADFRIIWGKSHTVDWDQI